MRRAHIGELEELVLLTVGSLTDHAYAVSIMEEIKSTTHRSLDVTAIHSVLRRLEKKGYVSSEMGGASKERGGRRKRMFTLTQSGRRVLDETMALRYTLYQKLPKMSFFSLA